MVKRKPVAVIDACLIYPEGLRNTLMWLAWHKIYYARWTEQIHKEWMGNLAKNRPDLTADQINHIKTQMDTNIRGALIRNYEDSIEQLSLPDPNDRHVLAAAIKVKADFIVTENLKDFPARTLKKYGIRPLSADNFIMELVAIDSQTCLDSFKKQLSKMRAPAMSAEEFLQSLIDRKLSKTVAFLKPHTSYLEPKKEA